MKKLNYTAPAVEIIELEVEGIIAGSFRNLSNEPGGGNVVNSTKQAAPSMDGFNWK